MNETPRPYSSMSREERRSGVGVYEKQAESRPQWSILAQSPNRVSVSTTNANFFRREIFFLSFFSNALF